MVRPDSAPSASRWRVVVPALLLGAAIVAAYANSFTVPFLFDDLLAIVRNPTIRHLGQLGQVLQPPSALGATVGGRPLLNLTFALNYALSGSAVWSYHAVNLAVHVGSALLLFGLVGRLAQNRCAHPRLLATTITALWALHPLQTESVTYLAQRAESLAATFILLTLYAFVRALTSRRPAAWLAASAAATVLGVLTKETAAVAPVLVMLLDRAVGAGGFASALRQRRWYYAALAASWIVVALLVLGTGNRGGTAGLGTDVSIWSYLLTQAGAIPHYLRLVFWPSPLVFDYGTRLASGFAEVWPPFFLLTAGAIATILAAWRGRLAGLLGLAFLLLLAPSSSFVPVASQTMAEHRMYLPLAAVLTGVALVASAWLGRLGLAVLLAVAVLGGSLTWRRNEVYQSATSIWRDTVASAPANPRAHNNLGGVLLPAGAVMEATAHFETALQLQPDYPDAHNNLGNALMQVGRSRDALPHFELALRARPRSADILTNYGSALAQVGRLDEAIERHTQAAELAPEFPDPLFNRGNAHYARRDYAAAVRDYSAALALDPRHHDARFNLGITLIGLGRPQDALREFRRVLELTPDDAAAHAETANILAHLGQTADAVAHYEECLRLKPDFEAARINLARLRAVLQRSTPSP
ncbi:tetratricopeptide repeat protein [Opitutus sp. ER46]|uniref:tetratricopeptide repeat protein n=1 Tax=Opitutus sp. ER46 TaxID=2161864 RepID=UPI000D2F624D|nr:tetratricopeptide repeat protein [Opitutus sp. ER46]PTX97846.1 hypothetical protein DB354_06090 [Opitutus sp. ER46]